MDFKDIIDHTKNTCIEKIYEDEKDIGIANGLGSSFLFLSNIYNSNLEPINNKQRLIEIMNEMITTINNKGISLSLYSGLSGIGCCCLEVVKEVPNLKRLLKQVVNLIAAHIKELTVKDNMTFQRYDLFNGVVGILSFLVSYYQYQREKRVEKLIYKLSYYLIEISKINVNNLSESYIFLKPNKLPKNGESRRLLPYGAILLGQAHGLSGILSVLSSVYDIFKIKVVKMHITNLLWFLQKVKSTKNLYPEYITIDYKGKMVIPKNNLNGGWCFGSLGTTRAIMLAARSIEDENLYNQAVNDLSLILKNFSTTIRSNSLIMCHGLANMAYTAYLAYKETGKNNLQTISRKLIQEILSSANPNKKYLFSDVSENLRGESRYEFGLLEGEVGVSLALNSIITESAWNTDWAFLFH